MTDERSKYQTDPLDPDFAVRRTEEIKGATRDVRRNNTVERAREHAGADAPTRIFEDVRERDFHVNAYEPDPLAIPYPSVFATPANNIPHEPQAFDPANAAGNSAHTRGMNGAMPPPTSRASFAQERAASGMSPDAPTGRVVRGLGLPENLLVVAPYAPLFLGAIAGIVELLLVPRDERRVRFHAAQGLALHGVVLVVALLLRLARFLGVLAFGGIASGLMSLVWFAFFVVSIIFFVQMMMRVWRGAPVQVEAVAETTKWIEEQIKPQK
jgi:uncharacterized membrane protein